MTGTTERELRKHDLVPAIPAILILILCAGLFLFAQFNVEKSHLRYNGDEPAALLTTISIVKHHSLNIYRSYIAKDYRDFGFAALDWQVPPVNGFIPPEKGIGFPALIAPLYALMGVDGSRFALVAINALTFPLLFLNCIWTGSSRIAAALACLALASVMPWETHAGQIVPEALAGSITMAILAAYFRFKQTGHWGYAGAIGLMTVLLPIVYLKYTPLAVASGVLLLSNQKLRWNIATYTAAPILLAYSALWISVYGYSIAVGTGGGASDFSLSVFPHVFWYAFLDRLHGEFVWAPLTILFVAGVFFWRRPFDVQAYLVTAILLYAALYGFTTFKSPGYSAPGRYLCAATPAMVMLAAITWLRDRALLRLRVAVFCVFTLSSASILIDSIAEEKSHLPQFYADIFPRLYDR